MDYEDNSGSFLNLTSTDTSNMLIIEMAYPEDVLKPWIHENNFIPIVITHCITFLVGVIGNVLVVFTMTGDHHTRNATMVFLISLAVADLILLIFRVPYDAGKYFIPAFTLGNALCKLATFMEVLSAMASILNLTAVSLERYIVIVYPMKSRTLCTMANCRRALGILWFLALILTTPVLTTKEAIVITYVNRTRNISVSIAQCQDVMTDEPRAIALYQLFLMFIIPSLLMVFCYARVVKELWISTKNMATMTQVCNKNGTNHQMEDYPKKSLTGSQRSPTHGSQKHSAHRQTNSSRQPLRMQVQSLGDDVRQTRKQVIKMLITIVVLFLVCWGPRLIWEVQKKFGLQFYSPIMFDLNVAINLLPFVHSCLNPFIYGFMSSNFRRSMVKVCERHCLSKYHRTRRETFSNSSSRRSGRRSSPVSSEWSCRNTEYETVVM